MPKREFYQIAAVMIPEEIHPEVIKTLNHIAEVLKPPSVLKVTSYEDKVVRIFFSFWVYSLFHLWRFGLFSNRKSAIANRKLKDAQAH